MKIVWTEFDPKISLDNLYIKKIDHNKEIEQLYSEIADTDSSDEAVLKHEKIIALQRDELNHPDNQDYMRACRNAVNLFGIINDSASNVYFRLEDGRQIGPIKSVDAFLQVYGGAQILSWGIESLPRRAGSHISFSKEAPEELRNKWSSFKSVQVLPVQRRKSLIEKLSDFFANIKKKIFKE